MIPAHEQPAANDRRAKPERRRLKRWIGGWLVVSVVMGLLQAIDGRYAMNPDGIAYLDVGDAYFAGNWSVALNGYWSPMYAWCLGLVLRLVRPDLLSEFPLAHALNYLVYLLALATFSWCTWSFLTSSSLAQTATNATIRDCDGSLPAWASVSISYALFIWTSLNLTSLNDVTPDLLVSAVVYALAALLIRVHTCQQSARTFAVIGLLLGIGYLVKAVLLPLSGVFILALVVADGKLRPRHVSIAIAVFALVALPYAFALSRARGHPTFGDSGSLNYAWMVDGVRKFADWQGDPGATYGTPVHPTRRVLATPEVYEFGSPFVATFAEWVDPSYWYEGVQPRFKLDGQLRVLGFARDVYGELLGSWFGITAASLVVLVLLTQRDLRTLEAGRGRLSLALAIPPVFALALYSLVHVEPRFIGGLVTLLGLALLALARLPKATWLNRAVRLACVVTLVSLGALIWTDDGDSGLNAIRAVRAGSRLTGSPQTTAAVSLQTLGLQPGDRVAVVGDGFEQYWARLLRVRVVAQISSGFANSQAEDIFYADASARQRALQILTGLGVRAVIATQAPQLQQEPGWQPVPGTQYVVYLNY